MREFRDMFSTVLRTIDCRKIQRRKCCVLEVANQCISRATRFLKEGGCCGHRLQDQGDM